MVCFYSCDIPLGFQSLEKSIGKFLSVLSWEHILAASKTPSHTVTYKAFKEGKTFLILVHLMLYATPVFSSFNHIN